jgi:hypothetical protein
MGKKKKPTLDEKLLAHCYELLIKETGDIPTVNEVQELYRQKYGSKGHDKI